MSSSGSVVKEKKKNQKFIIIKVIKMHALEIYNKNECSFVMLRFSAIDLLKKIDIKSFEYIFENHNKMI